MVSLSQNFTFSPFPKVLRAGDLRLALHQRDRDPPDLPEEERGLRHPVHLLEQDHLHGVHPLPHNHSPQHHHRVEDHKKLKVQEDLHQQPVSASPPHQRQHQTPPPSQQRQGHPEPQPEVQRTSGGRGHTKRPGK